MYLKQQLSIFKIKGVALLVFIVFVFGCSRSELRFSTISTEGIDFSTINKYELKDQEIEAEEQAQIYFIFSANDTNSTDVVSKAISKIPGCVGLVSGSIQKKSFYIPFIYGQKTIRVSAQRVWILKNNIR